MTTPSTSDLSALREVAEKATPDWELRKHYSRTNPDFFRYYIVGESDVVDGKDIVCEAGNNDRTFDEDNENMEYIFAARPQTVLALLDHLAAEKARADAAEAKLTTDEPPLTCPHIDAVVAMNVLPTEAVTELHEIRDINSQLRYGTWALKATISTLTAERDALRAKLATADALITCCCGSPVDTHGIGDGHSPVDMYHYAHHQMEERLATAERERDEARAFIRSFKFTVAENSFYKDCYLHLIEPDAVSFRISNDSTRSRWIGQLEARRSALSGAKDEREG